LLQQNIPKFKWRCLVAAIATACMWLTSLLCFTS